MTFLRAGFGLVILVLLSAPLLILWFAPEQNVERALNAFKPWVPVYQGLIWPVFILATVAFFTPQIKDAITGFINAVVRQGRSLEIPNILKLGEGLNSNDLATPSISANDLSVADLSMEDFVEKGSLRTLEELQSRLQAGERFNVLVLSDKNKFSKPLLREYVTTLGLRFVVFTTGEREFDGWIPAGLFAAQLPTLEMQRIQGSEPMLRYEELKQTVAGIRHDQIPSDTPAADALKLMQDEKTDALAIVEQVKFKAMLEQDAIVARMMLDTYERAQTTTTAWVLSEDEAISLMSVAVDFGVTQVVDGNWGVHITIKKAVFPARSDPN